MCLSAMLLRPPRTTLFPYTTALPILEDRPADGPGEHRPDRRAEPGLLAAHGHFRHLDRPQGHPRPGFGRPGAAGWPPAQGDRKSTRLNSSHVKISYAVFCLKKKN